jgi:hypothetical protein
LGKMVNYFRACAGTYAIILSGSLARGKAVKGSCIDLFIFLNKREFGLLASRIKRRTAAYSRMGGRVCYYSGNVEGGVIFDGDIRVDLGFTDGHFDPQYVNPFDVTRDEFETTIGNLFVYARVLYARGSGYKRLRQKYVPFYDPKLRETRLSATVGEFRYKIWKTQWLARRGEYLAAFDTLLESRRIFLQYLFIRNRKYPIDYSKWIEYQCNQILGMPQLYGEIRSTIEGVELTRNGILKKSIVLRDLFKKYARDN